MKRRKNYGIGRTKSRPGTGKQAAVLALCVSLWMAGGSVAGAQEVDLSTWAGDTVAIDENSLNSEGQAIDGNHGEDRVYGNIVATKATNTYHVISSGSDKSGGGGDAQFYIMDHCTYWYVFYWKCVSNSNI